MKTSILTLLALLGLSSMWANADRPANLVINGSFEQSSPLGPMLNFPVGSTDITGWTVINANIDYLDMASANANLRWQAANGTRSIDLAGSPGIGGVQQVIPTLVGAEYEVSFALAGNPSPTTSNPPIKHVRVSAAGQSAVFSFDITGKTFTDMGWVYKTWKFTAAAESTTIALTNDMSGQGADLYGPAIDDVSVRYVHDGYLWGVKSRDPISDPPSTLFKFTPSGSFVEVGSIILNGLAVDVDGLAMNAAGNLYAFVVNSAGSASQMLKINRDSAVASAAKPVLAGCDIRGACFDHLGRLLAIDAAGDRLLQIDPATGQILRVLFVFPSMSNLCDITQQRDGTFMVADEDRLYRLTLLQGKGVYCSFFHETSAGQEGDPISMAGLAIAEFGSIPDLLYMYDVCMKDDLYTYQYNYDPASKLTRQTLVANLIPNYNAGRGDLASAPAALLDYYPITQWSIAQGGNNHWYQTVRLLGGVFWQEASDIAVCRGGTLVTIHSQAENNFCYSLITDPILWYFDGWGSGIGPWIGGYELGEHVWIWVTAEPWAFTAWAPGEPNNLGGHEAFAHFFSNTGALMNNTWNDIGAEILIRGFLVEWSQAAGPYNMIHLSDFSTTWQTAQEDLSFNPAWDLTGDGSIDMDDLTTMAADWLE